MNDTWYFFHQQEAKSKWVLALASQRQQIYEEKKPELSTILDVNSPLDGDVTIEEKDKLRYRGPMYFDFDSEDTEEVIHNFKEFLTKLRSKGANLNALRIYCSGGKGFHVEMPAQVLMAKIPPHGVNALPLIYREVAYEMYVNTLDMRVYSQGKGRQWRCPNVKRANGKYKVQITPDEAFDMDPDMYATLTSYPRPLFPVEEAVFNPDLALIYSKARDKVDNGIKGRRKRRTKVHELARFKGEWPETLKTILSGQGLKDKVGWNYLCVQLAVTADSLGKTEEQLLSDAEGLIQTYEGDSSRYGSPMLRRHELRDKFRYFSGNPCYEFSIGGVLSLVNKDVVETSDLTQGDFVPDGTEGEDEAEDDEVTVQVRVNTNGMYSRTETGWRNISHLGFGAPILLMLPDGTHVGYDIDILVNGVKKGRKLMNLSALATKASLHSYAMTYNASFRGTDMDAAHIVDLLRHRVESKSRVALVTQVEGVDLILPHGAVDESELELIWSSPQGVVSTGPNQYTFRPLQSAHGTYRSDLYNAPSLSNCEEDRQMIKDLLAINTPQNLARILGWYGATFLCPVLRRFHKQFPLLQIYGGASAGKSKTISLLSHMHYNLVDPKIVQSSGMTAYPLLVAASSSSSIPLVLEEVRARLLTGGKYETIINLFKSNYDGHGMERGALGEKGASPVVNHFANTAPIVFTAEEKNGEVAIQERSVMVALSEMDRYGRDKPYDRLLSRANDLGRLGKSMVLNALSLDIPSFRKEFNEVHDGIKESMGRDRDGKDRPIYNLAVTIIGLRFMHAAVQQVFEGEFDGDFELMAEVVRENVVEFVPHNMSESARVLDTMAQLTKILDIQFKMDHGREYTVSTDGSTVDIRLKPAYAKYMRYMRSLGSTPMYDSDQAFIAAMARYGGVVSKSCHDNEQLFESVLEPLYRFSVSFMAKDNIEPFKD